MTSVRQSTKLSNTGDRVVETPAVGDFDWNIPLNGEARSSRKSARAVPTAKTAQHKAAAAKDFGAPCIDLVRMTGSIELEHGPLLSKRDARSTSLILRMILSEIR